ncbi:MAG: 5'/3'-nucleotidase SurE [Vulcanimicrobiota bacterium]
MNIFVTNDDGVFAKGLRELVKELKKIARVVVVAPDRERSAIGHAVTFFDPLRMHKLEESRKSIIYSSTGTPTDCILLGLCHVMKKKPDLVITGINIGPNMGDDITYSGTVSSAMEGALRGIPTMAVSVASFKDPHFSTAAVVAARLAPIVVENGLEPRTFLNINVPSVPIEEIKGIEITSQGESRYIQQFEEKYDPRGKAYYWFANNLPEGIAEEGTDFHAIRRNFVSVTPLQLNLTCHKTKAMLKEWNLSRLVPFS